MTTVNIPVNVPNIGTIPGTCRWLAETLETAEIRMGQTRDGRPCITLEATYNGKERSKVLAVFGYYDPEFDNTVTALRYMDYIEPDLFFVTLTPAAFERLKELGDEAAQLLSELLEEQDSEAPTLHISRKSRKE